MKKRNGLRLLGVLALILSLSFAVALGGAQDAIPQPRPKDRYESLRGHPPFSLATIATPPPAPQASFAANWFVSGIARIGDQDYVTIKAETSPPNSRSLAQTTL